MIDSDIPLSPVGASRRERILVLAKKQARQRRGRRVVRLAGVYILLAATAAFFVHHPSTPQLVRSTPKISPSFHPPIITSIGHGTITYIQTEAGIASRLAMPRKLRHWQVIGDDELIQTLAAAGQPAGLIRMNGHAILLTR
jgi:hypothetical protein